MANTFGNNKTLSRVEIDNAIFKVDEEISIENEKEFVNVLVLVPMVLALHHRHPDDGVIYFAKRLIVPLVRASIREFLHIDQLEWCMQNVEISFVREFFTALSRIHAANLTTEHTEVAEKNHSIRKPGNHEDRRS